MAAPSLPATRLSTDLSTIDGKTYDLIVVGGIPGGIACAVRGAREGLSVLLTHHTGHLGGFLTSGAGGWEAPYDGIRSPIFDEVRRRITATYSAAHGPDSAQVRASMPDTTRNRLGRPRVEPRIAEQVFEEMVAAEPNLTVLRQVIVTAVQREGRTIQSITLRDRPGKRSATVRGRVFADCTNEGDLVAAAGVPYRVGREARSEFDESLAGVIFLKPRTGDPNPATVTALQSLNLREVGDPRGLDIDPASTGEADGSVMTYNYRIILTKNPANRVRVTRPENYDPAALGNPLVVRGLVPNLPNDKIAWNGGGRLIGPQHGYPEGSWVERERISQQYLNAAIGRLWYCQNDPAASAADREFWKDYGLAKDEFVDNGHLPYEIYVREARRLIGRHIFTQHDFMPVNGMERPPIHPDSVAITDWSCDSTVCTERTVNGLEDGKYMVLDLWRPAQVPYRSLLPIDLDNLLVPVCLSSTHVGWGTLRLEPVWMQTGEAAGFAAAQALAGKTTPAEINLARLSQTLAERGFMLTYFGDLDPATHNPWKPEAQDLATDTALQFLGTRGYFSDFHAAGNQPISRHRAEQWLELTARWLNNGPVDATAAAREISPTPTDKFPHIPRSEFTKRLREFSHGPEMDGATDDPLTQSEAARLIYACLIAKGKS